MRPSKLIACSKQFEAALEALMLQNRRGDAQYSTMPREDFAENLYSDFALGPTQHSRPTTDVACQVASAPIKVTTGDVSCETIRTVCCSRCCQTEPECVVQSFSQKLSIATGTPSDSFLSFETRRRVEELAGEEVKQRMLLSAIYKKQTENFWSAHQQFLEEARRQREREQLEVEAKRATAERRFRDGLKLLSGNCGTTVQRRGKKDAVIETL